MEHRLPKLVHWAIGIAQRHCGVMRRWLITVFVLPLAQLCVHFLETIVFFEGNKLSASPFYYVDVSGSDFQLDSFGEPAMPLFDQLYKFSNRLARGAMKPKTASGNLRQDLERGTHRGL